MRLNDFICPTSLTKLGSTCGMVFWYFPKVPHAEIASSQDDNIKKSPSLQINHGEIRTMYFGLCNKKDKKKELRQQLGVTSEHQKS